MGTNGISAAAQTSEAIAVTALIVLAIASAAGVISVQWNGAETASGSARGWYAHERTNFPSCGTAKSSSVFQSARAWQG